MLNTWRKVGAVIALVGGLCACSQPAVQATFHAEDDPRLLSDWGVFDVSAGAVELSEGVVSYDLTTPLFTDYAHKLRTIWLPEDAAPGVYRKADYPDLPIGTVISKTFYYPRAEAGSETVRKTPDVSGALNPQLQSLDLIRLIETRLLVRREAGWQALSYVWTEDQSDAVLTKIGAAKRLTLRTETGTETGAEEDFAYIVPNINQCAGCHAPNNTTREIVPLGVRPRHLNKAYVHADEPVNQLEYLQALAYLTDLEPVDSIATNADWTDPDASLEARARSYLDINCSHCHNPVGPADTSGLDLTMAAALGPALGVCKLPIAAGSGTGGRMFSIVPGAPHDSILQYRMESTDPGSMMPELGRALQHAEGAALIHDWIADMSGNCRS
ncbi:MAG: SO2930 family diheme c-type cytochrome [Pseudomonadota bacterium]